MITRKSKYNKLKPGDVVELKKHHEFGLKWYVEHLSWSYGNKPNVPVGDQAYDPNQKEILPESFLTVHGLLYHWLSGKPLIGKVDGYGSEDYIKDKVLKKLNVLVTFKLKPFNVLSSMYVSERTLTKIK